MRSERMECPGSAIPIDDRLGLLVVDREPPRHDLRRVVGPPLLVRTTEGSSSRRLVVEIEEEHCVERPADRVEHLVELLGLNEVARESVEDEPTARIVLREPVADQRDRQLIRHELAGCEDRLHLAAEVCSLCDRGAEHVPRRDVGNTVGCADPLCLRALPGSLRPENEDVDRRYLRKPS